jgi:uncharacterized protein YkwD
MKALRPLTLFVVLVLAAGVARASEIKPESVLRLMNAYRAVNGLDPLTIDSRLDNVATARIDDMVERAYWAHVAPDGSKPFPLFPKYGYYYRSVGENLAKGFETAEVLVASWMESPGHRANILNPVFQNVGIAIIDGEPNRRAVGKSIVVVFGAEKQDVATAKR